MCPAGFTFARGYARGDHFKVESLHAKSIEKCAFICVYFFDDCHAFMWHERNNWCVLQNAKQEDVDPDNQWNQIVTCVRGKN